MKDEQKDKTESTEKETTLYPMFGYGMGMSGESYNDWMNDLVYDLIQMDKIDPDKYENKEGYRVPYVPLEDILRACNIDKQLDLLVLESECFNKYYSEDCFYLWFDDEIFEETLTTIEKKNITLTVLHEMGLKLLKLEQIHTMLDIVEF